MKSRLETRRERYENKKSSSIKLPIEICTVNFRDEANVAFLLRSAVCFGASAINVIGSLPRNKILTTRSGTTQDYIRINQFSNPHEFIEYSKQNYMQIVSAELVPEAQSIFEFNFKNCLKTHKKICLVAGHEEIGVPEEIVRNSIPVFIPMPGTGYCLNTAIAGSVFLYESTKQLLTANVN